MAVAGRIVVEGHDFGGMGLMEWGLAPIEEVGSQIDAPGDEVVGIGTPCEASSIALGDRKILLSTTKGPWFASTVRSWISLSWQRLLEIRAPWVIQSSQMPRQVR